MSFKPKFENVVFSKINSKNRYYFQEFYRIVPIGTFKKKY